MGTGQERIAWLIARDEQIVWTQEHLERHRAYQARLRNRPDSPSTERERNQLYYEFAMQHVAEESARERPPTQALEELRVELSHMQQPGHEPDQSILDQGIAQVNQLVRGHDQEVERCSSSEPKVNTSEVNQDLSMPVPNSRLTMPVTNGNVVTERDRIQMELGQLRQQAKDLRLDIEEYRKEAKKMDRAHEELKVTLLSLTTQKKGLEAEVEDLGKQTQSLRMEKEGHRVKILEYVNEAEAYKRKAVAVVSKIKELENVIADARAENEGLRKLKIRLYAEIDDLRSDRKHCKTELLDVIDGLEYHRPQMEAIVEKAFAEADLYRKFDSYWQKHQELVDQNDEQQTELELLRHEVQAYRAQQKRKTVPDDENWQEEHIDHLERELQAAREERMEAADNLYEVKKAKKKMEDERDKYKFAARKNHFLLLLAKDISAEVRKELDNAEKALVRVVGPEEEAEYSQAIDEAIKAIPRGQAASDEDRRQFLAQVAERVRLRREKEGKPCELLPHLNPDETLREKVVDHFMLHPFHRLGCKEVSAREQRVRMEVEAIRDREKSPEPEPINREIFAEILEIDKKEDPNKSSDDIEAEENEKDLKLHNTEERLVTHLTRDMVVEFTARMDLKDVTYKGHKLPFFSGQPGEDWLQFRKAFEENPEIAFADEAEKKTSPPTLSAG